MRGLRSGAVALCALLGGALAAAASGPLIVPIAGLAGGDVQVAGALRTSDGGAIVLARVSSAPSASQGRLVVFRLEANGSLNLAYGSEGRSELGVDPRAQPTALAIDPASGDAWVGASVGGAGEIVALDREGGPAHAFGRGGVLSLPPADAGGPVSLDWRAGELLVAAGRRPCRGCSLSIRSPISGRALRSRTLAQGELGGGGCHPSLSRVAFTAADRELAATDASTRSGCGSALVALGPSLRPSAGGPAPGSGALSGHASVIGGGGGVSWGCVAASSATATWLSSYATASATASRPAKAPAGTLIAIAPVAPGSCAALVRTARGGVVAQMRSGEASAATDALPGSLAPLAMFRCHQHLLVVGTTGGPGRRAAGVVAVALRGAHASGASTGCR